MTTETKKLDAELLDVRALAAKLSCSTRHIYRLADAGRLPAPTRLGSLVRWNRRSIQEWLDAGCPFMHTAKVHPPEKENPAASTAGLFDKGVPEQ